MTRCDCEGLFYRVFCISLLIIAFTFTVILTNVFVDIDNLLNKTGRETTENVREKEPITDNHETTSTTEVQDYYIGLETNGEINYRNKRSLDSENFFLRINNPKTKSYLTNKLATLLEALDDDDQDITSPKPDNGNIYIKTVKQKNNIEINELLPESDKPVQMPDENIVYSALHNMLQGIGGVDLYRLVDKLQTLIRNFKRDERQKETKNAKSVEDFFSEVTTKEAIDLNEEREDVTETSLKYGFADKNVRSNKVFTPSYIETPHVGDKRGVRNKNPTYMIKTFIDIEKDGKAISTEDVYGIIKMTFNGKPIKTKRGQSFEATTERTITFIQNTTSNVTNNTINNDVEQFADVLREKFKNRLASDTYLKTIALEYLKKIAKSNDSLAMAINNKIRAKRNVDSSNEKQTETLHTKDDDELFVEIETHFDRSGMAGEKKRKLVTNLIEKIQKAIRSNPENNPSQDNNQNKPLIKRIQSPLDSETVQVQSKPDSGAYRTLDPISKSMPITDPLPLVANKDGEQWKKQYPQPKFLSLSKSINSAELNQIAVDFKQEEKYPPVPKRVQIPLTVDTSQETINTEDIGKLQLLIKDIEGTGFSIGYNQYIDQAPDPESIKLFHGIEDIVKKYHQKNDSPDQLEKHEGDYEMYGQEMKKRDVKSVDAPLRTKRFVINRQNIRQSVKNGNDYHQNELIYNDHYRAYDTYKEVHDVSKRSSGFLSDYIQRLFLRRNENSLQNPHRKKRAVTLKTLVNSNRKLQVNKFLNTNTFTGRKTYFKLSKRRKRQVEDIEATDKTAITSENKNIFVVTDGDDYNDNLFVRRRQEPDFFFIEVINSNNANPIPKNKPFFQPSYHPFGSHMFKIQSKNKFYTNPMFYKRNANLIKIQENKERTKRQLHTLRIIDRDIGIRNSNQEGLTEDGGDSFAKTEVISQRDGPQIIDDEDEKGEVKYSSSKPSSYKAPLVSSNSFATDSNEYDSFKPKSPAILSNKKTYSKHDFGISPTWEQMIEHPLMAKYPHIFQEGIRELPQIKHYQRRMLPKEESKESGTFDDEESYPSSNVQDLVHAVLPSQKKHYKVSIRLIPHENDHDTNSNPSFKEIHTSINKTFNKDGYLFSSLVNVSEISNVKIPNVNTTHICNHHLNSTTPNILDTKSNIPVSRRGTNRGINKHVQISTEKPIENTTKSKIEMNLMDIILPPSPQKVFHLTVADLGKLICNAMKSQTPEKPSASYSETTEQTTTSSTTIMTTIIPKRRSTHTAQTVDPLKTKLLKAISQNEQLTSQILNRIDQNTDILQTFLSKITSEIAKLPDMTSKAIQERDIQARQENNSLFKNIDAKFYTTTMTTPIAVTYAHHKTSQNLKQASRHQSLIQTSPILKNRVMIDRRLDFPTIQTNIVEPRQNEQAKYFLDKNLVPHETADKHVVTDGVVGKTSKLDADVITHNKLDHKI